MFQRFAFVLSGAVLAAAVAVSPASAQDKKVLTIGISQEFEALNPVISQMAASSLIAKTVLRSLVTIDSNWKWVCVLCKELPSLENKLAKIVTQGKDKRLVVSWELNDAKWGDGTPVTGEDVKFAWTVGKNPNVSVGEKDIYDRIVDIQVDAKNPKKFTMTFKEPRYDFYQLGTFYIIPKHIEGPVFEKTKGTAGAYEKQTMFNSNPLTPGLYNGPYRVADLKLGSHVTLERNPNFFGQAPAFERVVFKLIPNTQTLEANLLSGTIDMISELGVAFDQALALEKRINANPALKKKFKVNFRQGPTYEHVTFNYKSPIVSDLRVRRALVQGVDRAKLVQALFEGRQPVALHNIHPLDPYYTDKVAKNAYDAAGAAKLLDEAGWKLNAKGIREKDGKPLSLTLMTTAQNKTRELVQVFLQSEWKKLGIEAKIKNEPARVFFGETVKKGIWPDLAMFAWVSSPDNPPRSTMHSGEIPTAKNSYGGQNGGSFKNAEADKLLNEIPNEFNFAKRKQLMERLQQIYAEELPAMPLYLRAEISVSPANITGYQLNGHQFYSTQSIEYWKLGGGAVAGR